MANCKICKTQIGQKYGPYCRNCDAVLWQLKELILEPYLNGTIDHPAKEFLPELDFLFMRNFNVQSIFNLAWQMWLDFTLGENEINLIEYEEFNCIKVSKQNYVLQMLKSIKMITINQNRVRPGELIKNSRVMLSGRDFTNAEYKKVYRESRAILTIAIAIRLIEQEEGFIPHDLCCIMEVLSQHMFNNPGEGEIPALVPKDVFEKVLKKLPPRQRLKLKIDLVGLNPWGARIIKDVDKEENIVLKKSCVGFLEYSRTRLRERERER